jgi:hypothetical protein
MEIVSVAHLDHHLHEMVGHAHGGDVAAVNLQDIYGEQAELGNGRVPGPEVVEGGPDTEAP